jgi:hypothetical protein
MATINELKEQAQAARPVILATFTFADGSVYRCATGAFTYGGNAYAARIDEEDIDRLAHLSESGVDRVPSATLRLADPDGTLWTSYERAVGKGFKGARLTLAFVFYDVATDTYSSDSITPFVGVCDTPAVDEKYITITAHARLNLSRFFLPTFPIQVRCPKLNPVNAAQRALAADPNSPFYLCGETRDVAVAPPCAYTKETCTQPARYAGAIWAPPQTGEGREYISGSKIQWRNADTSGKYKEYWPLWLGGKAWVECPVLNVVGDANYSRGEVAIGYGKIDVQKVIVNGVELTQGMSGDYRWHYVNQGTRDGTPNQDVPYNGTGDPYGSMTVIQVLAPRAVMAPDTLPQVRVLGQRASLRVYRRIVQASGNGGAITITFDGANQDCAGNPPFTVTVEGNSLANGTHTLTNWTYGPPGTITLATNGNGTVAGGWLWYETTGIISGSGASTPWVLMEALRWAGLEYSEMDVMSFADCAKVCNAAIDPAGSGTPFPRFSSAMALRNRRSAAEIVRGLRQSIGAMLVPTPEGKIRLQLEGPLAEQQPAAVDGSNYNFAGNSTTRAGVATNGYAAYSFDESNSWDLKRTARPISDSPNRVSFAFQDSTLGDALSTFSLSDSDDMARTDQEQPGGLQVEPEGIAGHNHALRCAKLGLFKIHRGNPEADTRGTDWYEWQCSFRGVRLRVGDIVILSNERLGLQNQPIRLTGIKPSKNFATLTLSGHWHSDSWYLDSTGASADPTQIAEDVPPFPWEQTPGEDSTPPAAPSLVTGQDLGVRAIDSTGRIVNAKIRLTVNHGTDAESIKWWISYDDGANWEEAGLDPAVDILTVIDFWRPAPQGLSNWKLKAITNKASAAGDPAAAVVSASFQVAGIGACLPNDITAVVFTPVTGGVNADGAAYASHDLAWNNPSSAADPNFWYARIRVETVDAAGNPGGMFPDRRLNQDAAGYGRPATIHNFGWPILLPPYDTYRLYLYAVSHTNEQETLQTQVSWNGGPASDHFDWKPTINVPACAADDITAVEFTPLPSGINDEGIAYGSHDITLTTPTAAKDPNHWYTRVRVQTVNAAGEAGGMFPDRRLNQDAPGYGRTTTLHNYGWPILPPPYDTYRLFFYCVSQLTEEETLQTGVAVNGGPASDHYDWKPDPVPPTEKGKLSEIISVRDYGAVGDGATDCTEAFATAVADIGARGGGSIFIPPGTYLVGASISMPANVVLYGDGQASIVKRSADIADGVGLFDIATQNVELFDFTIDGDVTVSAGLRYDQFAYDPMHALLTKNTSVWVHAGAKNVRLTMTVTHTGGYAVLLDATAGNIDDVSITQSRFVNNRPHTFGVADGDLGYGSWTGGVHYQSDGNLYAVRNLRVANCEFARNTGNCVWGHLYAFGTLHSNIRISGNHFLDCGLDGVLTGGVTGGTVEHNTFRRIGYITSDDSSPAVPRLLAGKNAVGLDTSGIARGVNYVGNTFVSCNGGCMDLDGYCEGTVSGNSCIVPKLGDPEYTEDQVGAHWGGGQNWTYGCQPSNSTNNAWAGQKVTITGNTFVNMKGGAIRLYATRGGIVTGNNIDHPADAAMPPIVIGNIGTGPYQRAINNVVCYNRIAYTPAAQAPAITEDAQYGAFQPGDANRIFHNVLIGANVYEFLRNDGTSSTVGFTVSTSDATISQQSESVIEREASGDLAALIFYKRTAAGKRYVAELGDVGLWNVAETDAGGALLARSGKMTTGSRTTFAGLTDYLYTGKVIADGYVVIGNTNVSGEANGGVIPDTWALLRYDSAAKQIQQSTGVDELGNRIWMALGGDQPVFRALNQEGYTFMNLNGNFAVTASGTVGAIEFRTKNSEAVIDSGGHIACQSVDTNGPYKMRGVEVIDNNGNFVGIGVACPNGGVGGSALSVRNGGAWHAAVYVNAGQVVGVFNQVVADNLYDKTAADLRYPLKTDVYTKAETYHKNEVDGNVYNAFVGHIEAYHGASSVPEHDHNTIYYLKSEVYTKGESDGNSYNAFVGHLNSYHQGLASESWVNSNFSASGHTHNYAAASHTHNYAASDHTHSQYATQGDVYAAFVDHINAYHS